MNLKDTECKRNIEILISKTVDVLFSMTKCKLHFHRFPGGEKKAPIFSAAFNRSLKWYDADLLWHEIDVTFFFSLEAAVEVTSIHPFSNALICSLSWSAADLPQHALGKKWGNAPAIHRAYRQICICNHTYR